MGVKNNTEQKITELEQEIFEKKRDLAALYRESTPEMVGEYVFHRSTGEEVALSELFGDHDDLMLIHNMGKECRYCTMWADGFNGLLPHIEDRTAFVVSSPDEPETQQQFARSRGWSFTMVSTKETDFTENMGFADDGTHKPGLSTFHRDIDGTITRIASRKFGPQDDFCSAWHMFDILKDGINGWTPQYTY